MFIHIIDKIPIKAGAIYIMDRGYIDFASLHKIHIRGGQFVIRARKNLKNYRKSPSPVTFYSNLQCDQKIRLTLPKTIADYLDVLRRLHVIDKENNQYIVIRTNILSSTAAKIADYYKQRWQIELFFK